MPSHTSQFLLQGTASLASDNLTLASVPFVDLCTVPTLTDKTSRSSRHTQTPSLNANLRRASFPEDSPSFFACFSRYCRVIVTHSSLAENGRPRRDPDKL